VQKTGNPEIDRYMAQVTEQLQQFGGLQEQLATMTAEGFAAKELIRVEVGPSGNLKAIEINPRAMRLGSEELADAIMEATNSAVAKVTEKINEAMEPFLGADNGMGEKVTGNLAQAIPNVSGMAAPARSSDPVGEALRQLQRISGEMNR
jgi:DNA-binding YbaB/EbfC family protein